MYDQICEKGSSMNLEDHNLVTKKKKMKLKLFLAIMLGWCLLFTKFQA